MIEEIYVLSADFKDSVVIIIITIIVGFIKHIFLSIQRATMNLFLPGTHLPHLG